MYAKEREYLRRPVGLRRRRGKIRLEARAKGGDYERGKTMSLLSRSRGGCFSSKEMVQDTLSRDGEGVGGWRRRDCRRSSSAQGMSVGLKLTFVSCLGERT